MRLEHLRTDFLDMSRTTRCYLIARIRADRLINKRVVVKATRAEAKEGDKEKKRAKVKFDTTLASLDTLSPEQLAALAAALQKGA